MITEAKILEELAAIHAVIKNTHVVYTSGKHGSAYMNKDAIYPHTALTSQLCLRIAQEFVHSGVEVVVAPVLGGIILSQWVSHHLSQLTGREVLAVYAEKAEQSGEFIIKRGYDQIVRGRKVLVVEDVLTTGGSVKKVVQLTRSLAGQIIGVGALCNRGSITPTQLGEVPLLYSVLNLNLDAWDEPTCPLCANHTPINQSVGKGREYLSKQSETKSSGAV